MTFTNFEQFSLCMADNAMIMVITRLRWDSWPLCQKMPHKHYLLLNISHSLENSPRIFAAQIKVFLKYSSSCTNQQESNKIFLSVGLPFPSIILLFPFLPDRGIIMLLKFRHPCVSNLYKVQQHFVAQRPVSSLTFLVVNKVFLLSEDEIS